MPPLVEATNDFQKSITRAILHEVKEQIEKAKEEAVAQATEQFQKRVKEIIGNVAMDISNYYSIERIGQDILIRGTLQKTFREHVERWKEDTEHYSSLSKMIIHPSYMRIMGMGLCGSPAHPPRIKRSSRPLVCRSQRDHRT